MPRTVVLLFCLTLVSNSARPDEPTTEQLAEQVRKSVVIITTPGRDARRGGLGTGFVVGDGLIATNHHVIGEGRGIVVETPDGKKHPAVAVHAFDRNLDLAIVRIALKGLPVLPLADSAKVKDGQPVVAVGNPHGLKHSVVSGVLSGMRDIEGRAMLQLAMPVERGNSGGPVVDRAGHVVGVITSKSAVTENLGFAVGSNALKSLLARPNSVPMAAWETIGQLDPDDWKPMLGASWRQRAGRLLVEDPGTGFGGRSYCLSMQPIPKVPFEVAVTVKLDDEAGAAGLIFHDDGTGRHYGFYPSGGGFRLTRFDGSDVYSWKILEQKASDAYKPGDWNTIKVRVEKGKLLCYVNDTLAIESDDTGLTEGRVGLAKFRQTKAEFKAFRVAAKLAPDRVDALRKQAKELEEQAAKLRKQAARTHQKGVLDRLTAVLKEEKPDLLHAVLLIAKLDNEELDVESYRRAVERMARKVSDKLPKTAGEVEKRKALHEFLFTERGFHGSRGDYYHRSNSYLNEVLDDREGLPITLSVVYMELARRLGLKVEGVGLPGHFMARHVPAKGEPQLVDVYEGGKLLSRADTDKKIEAMTGEKPDEKAFVAVKPRAIVVRMFNNLLRVAETEKDIDSTVRYLDAIIALEPNGSARERVMRGLARAQQGDKAGALEDIDWILEKMPEDIDLDAVRAVRRRIERSR